MVVNGTKQDVGLALLGISSAFGIWSALNTSPVGTVQFAVSNPKVAYQGMNWGLGVILALSAGVGLYYGQKGAIAAITTAATGVGMWVWYDNLIKEHTIEASPFPIESDPYMPLM
jgi:hypothetical protein